MDDQQKPPGFQSNPEGQRTSTSLAPNVASRIPLPQSSHNVGGQSGAPVGQPPQQIGLKNIANIPLPSQPPPVTVAALKTTPLPSHAPIELKSQAEQNVAPSKVEGALPSQAKTTTSLLGSHSQTQLPVTSVAYKKEKKSEPLLKGSQAGSQQKKIESIASALTERMKVAAAISHPHHSEGLSSLVSYSSSSSEASPAGVNPNDDQDDSNMSSIVDEPVASDNKSSLTVQSLQQTGTIMAKVDANLQWSSHQQANKPHDNIVEPSASVSQDLHKPSLSKNTDKIKGTGTVEAEVKDSTTCVKQDPKIMEAKLKMDVDNVVKQMPGKSQGEGKQADVKKLGGTPLTEHKKPTLASGTPVLSKQATSQLGAASSKPENAPIQPAKAPIQPVQAPSQPVKAHIQPVKVPGQPIKLLREPVKAPGQSVSVPTQPGKGNQPIKAPTSMQSVKSPIQPVKGPKEPVKAPIQPVKGPNEPVRKPIQPVKGSNEPLKAPIQPVKGPNEPVKAPIQPVKGPNESLKAPIQPVKGPNEPVKAPIQPVKGPNEPVKAPNQPVKGPNEPVKTPIKPVKGPNESVKAPIQPVKGPNEPVKGPNVPVKTPIKPITAPSQPVKLLRQPIKAPGQSVTAPTQSVAMPGPVKAAYEPIKAPGQSVTAPTQSVAMPGPVKAAYEPIKAPTQSVAAPTQPIKTPIQPVKAPIKPVTTPSLSIAASPQPAKAPIQPIKAPSQPVKPSSQPVTAPSLPVKSIPQPVTAPTQRTATPSQPLQVPSQPAKPSQPASLSQPLTSTVPLKPPSRLGGATSQVADEKHAKDTEPKPINLTLTPATQQEKPLIQHSNINKDKPAASETKAQSTQSSSTKRSIEDTLSEMGMALSPEGIKVPKTDFVTGEATRDIQTSGQQKRKRSVDDVNEVLEGSSSNVEVLEKKVRKEEHPESQQKAPSGKEKIEDSSSRMTEEMAAGMAQNVVSGVVEEVVSGMVKDVSTKLVEEEVRSKTAEEVTSGMVEEVTCGMVKEVVASSVQEVTTVMAQEVSSGMVEEVTCGIVKEVASSSVEEVTTEVAQQVSSGVVEEVTSGMVKEVVSNTVNEATTEMARVVSLGIVDEVTSGMVKEVVSGTVEEVKTVMAEEVTTGMVEEMTNEIVKEVVTNAVEEAKTVIAEEVAKGLVEETSTGMVSEVATTTMEEIAKEVKEKEMEEARKEKEAMKDTSNEQSPENEKMEEDTMDKNDEESRDGMEEGDGDDAFSKDVSDEKDKDDDDMTPSKRRRKKKKSYERPRGEGGKFRKDKIRGLSGLSMLDEETRMDSNLGQDEDSQGSSSNNKREVRRFRCEVIVPESTEAFTADKVVEYMWPLEGVACEHYFIQEQISQYLGIMSFKRRYPDLRRRAIDMQERDYLKEKGLVSEIACDLGLTAVRSEDVLDVMFNDFPAKFEELQKLLREKKENEIRERGKVNYSLANIDKSKMQEYSIKAAADAARWNATLNREKREERRYSFDLQTFTLQMPCGRGKKLPPNYTKMGCYPVSVLPGQFTDYYREYSSQALKTMPLVSVVSAPVSDSLGSDGAASEEDDEAGNKKTVVGGPSVTKEETKPTEGPRCKVCNGSKHRNKSAKSEPLIICGTCRSASHPTCIDLTLVMLPKIESYNWQCMDCKTCVTCSNPDDEDKMIFCDMCDRGYHIFCVGLRKVPNGRWHCKECAICSSCGSKSPAGIEHLKNAEWQHEFKKDKDNKQLRYATTLCVPCDKYWKRRQFCYVCLKVYRSIPEDGMVRCSNCPKYIHREICSTVYENERFCINCFKMRNSTALNHSRIIAAAKKKMASGY